MTQRKMERDRFEQDSGRLTMFVFYLHGTEDPFVPYVRSLQAVRGMRTSDLTARLLLDHELELLTALVCY